MTIETISNVHFELKNNKGDILGSIIYSDASFIKGVMYLGGELILECISLGAWATYINNGDVDKILANIKVELGGNISIRKFYGRKKYVFKKPTNWKTRFALFNNANDELLTLLPTINWLKESHDFSLQINDEVENDCDAFIILHAIHCALCSLSMMTGGEVPALVSI
jgi:hypothetical protein